MISFCWFHPTARAPAARVWWTNVKALNDLRSASLHGVLVKKIPPASCDGGR
jgi:hypothetical protein